MYRNGLIPNVTYGNPLHIIAAHTWAMPDPIKPPPITVIRWIADRHDDVDIDLTCTTAHVFNIVNQNLQSHRNETIDRPQYSWRSKFTSPQSSDVAVCKKYIHAENVQSLVKLHCNVNRHRHVDSNIWLQNKMFEYFYYERAVCLCSAVWQETPKW